MMVEPEHSMMMLADYLRRVCHLTGTKIVCAEGDCGACTVLRWFPYSSSKNQFAAINSCISPMFQLDGSLLITIEGLSQPTPTPLQEAMVACHASQCGYCTPGIVMALACAVEKKQSALSVRDAKNALTGNLCRCTGYQPILEAATSLDAKSQPSIAKRFLTSKVKTDLTKTVRTPLLIDTHGATLYAPTSLKKNSDSLMRGQTVLGGSTDLGVLLNKQHRTPQRAMSLHLVRELYAIKKTSNKITVGARVTLTELRQFLKTSAPEFSTFLDLFASPQIKNIATLVGNIANASPIADTPPFLLVSDTKLTVLGTRGSRQIFLNHFYKGYRQTALKPGELITSLTFTVAAKDETVRLYKVSQRKDLDISTVNLAIKAKGKANALARVNIAMGGVAAVPIVFEIKSPKSVDQIIARTHGHIKPISDLRASQAYRRVVTEKLIRQFFAELK